MKGSMLVALAGFMVGSVMQLVNGCPGPMRCESPECAAPRDVRLRSGTFLVTPARVYASDGGAKVADEAHTLVLDLAARTLVESFRRGSAQVETRYSLTPALHPSQVEMSTLSYTQCPTE